MHFIKKLVQITKELYFDRHLMFDLAIKDFTRRFAGSYFGVAWGFIQPLLTILIYWVVFQYGFRSSNVGNIPFVLWFMAGIVPWLFIAEAISVSSNCYLEYSYLVKKVVFNIDILPMVKILSSLVIHLFFLAFVQIVFFCFGIWPTLKIVQLIYYLFCSIVLVYAISLIFSSIMVFFRDLGQIISLILMIGMWGTPIAWNINIFSSPRVQFILKLNPFYYIVEGYRDCFIGGRWFFQKTSLTPYFWLVTLMLLALGVLIYNRLKPHFADVL